MRASEAFPIKPRKRFINRNKSGEPIRASELVKRRHDDALAALQRAIDRREDMLQKLARLQTQIWKLGRQVKRYNTKLSIDTPG